MPRNPTLTPRAISLSVQARVGEPTPPLFPPETCPSATNP